MRLNVRSKMSVQKNNHPILKWRKIENSSGHLPKARHGHRAITIKNMMLIFGGGNDGIIDEFHVYMPRKYLIPFNFYLFFLNIFSLLQMKKSGYGLRCLVIYHRVVQPLE